MTDCYTTPVEYASALHADLVHALHLCNNQSVEWKNYRHEARLSFNDDGTSIFLLKINTARAYTEGLELRKVTGALEEMVFQTLGSRVTQVTVMGGNMSMKIDRR